MHCEDVLQAYAEGFQGVQDAECVVGGIVSTTWNGLYLFIERMSSRR